MTETDLLKGEGVRRITVDVRVRRSCEECGEPATRCHTFLLDGARSNPQSSAYRKDDCSWCSDEERYSCDAHENAVRKSPSHGHGWCSTFDVNRFPHRMLFWHRESVTETEPTR